MHRLIAVGAGQTLSEISIACIAPKRIYNRLFSSARAQSGESNISAASGRAGERLCNRLPISCGYAKFNILKRKQKAAETKAERKIYGKHRRKAAPAPQSHAQ
jgi:hypothetical protein